MTPTEQIDAYIAENGGSCRDALNVALAKLGLAEACLEEKNADAEAWRRVRNALAYGGIPARADDLRTASMYLRADEYISIAVIIDTIANILAEEQAASLREGLVKAWDGEGNELNVACGHPRSAIVSSKAGTGYCSMCEKEAVDE